MSPRKLDVPDEEEQALFREMVKEVTKRLRPDLVSEPTTPVQRQVGRNDPCPCGSGRKYKRCHGKDSVGTNR